jgi:hypothetical protein
VRLTAGFLLCWRKKSLLTDICREFTRTVFVVCYGQLQQQALVHDEHRT